MVAGTQKVLFLCNCCSTTLVPSLNDQSCCSGTTGRVKKAEWRQNHCHGGSSVAAVAEWRHSGRHSDRSMDAIGRPKEAQWWYKEGRRVAQIDTQCSHFLLGDQWPTTVHPFCDHGDVCAFILPRLSDLWATDLLGDLCATVLNMLKTSRRPWRPWRCLNVLCATLERPRQQFGLPSAFNGDLASFVVAQGRHKGRSPCVNGVLPKLGLKLTDVSKGRPGLLHTELEILVNRTCHPGGHYCDYYPGALLSVEGTASHLKVWYSQILSIGTNSSNFLQSKGWECSRIIAPIVVTWSPLY